MTLYDQKFGKAPRVASAAVVAPKSPVPATPTRKASPFLAATRNRSALASGALLIFTFLYYARPEDFIPGIAAVPVGKISGGLALFGLIVSWSRVKTKIPLAVKLVLLLLVHMCITVPVAFWRGGALDVVMNQFSKAAIVAVLISMIVVSVKELRRLLWVQAASVAVMTIASIIIHPSGSGGGTRLWGLGGVFSNPNDFAINIAINFPLCLAFFFWSKGIFKKIFWSTALLFLMYGVIATYSRSGLIAMLICFMICVWEFGIKGKRPHVIVAAILILMVGVAVGVSTPKYVARIETLVKGGDVEGSGDRGSMDARRELLMESIRVTFQHPIFGVGPGNFQAITESWHVTHNTYTELSSETGFPGLLLFLAMIYFTFRNLKDTSKTEAYSSDPQTQLFTSALRAGLSAYLVGAVFASTAYTLFPYFMVGYAAALYKISSSSGSPSGQQPVGTSLSRNGQNRYGKQQQPAMAGTR